MGHSSNTLCTRLNSRRALRAGKALIAACLMPAGCVDLPLPAKEQLNQAERDYRGRDYKSASAKLDDILRIYPEYAQSAEAYYLRAQCRIAVSNKLGAVSDLKKCAALSRDSQLTSNAHAAAGSLCFEAGNMAEASSHYAEALKKAPEKPPTDQIRYNYATSVMRQGDWRKARQQFALVFQRYPNSSLSNNAHDKFEWPFDYFVIQCGSFRDQAAANKHSTKLQGSGLSTRVEPRQRLGESLYIVCIGSYPKYDLAQEALRSVKNKCPGALIAPGL